MIRGLKRKMSHIEEDEQGGVEKLLYLDMMGGGYELLATDKYK